MNKNPETTEPEPPTVQTLTCSASDLLSLAPHLRVQGFIIEHLKVSNVSDYTLTVRKAPMPISTSITPNAP